MNGRGSRDRFRRDDVGPPPSSVSFSSSSSRFDDKSSRPPPPPSRHLWVGNLSPHVSESVIADLFIRFGDLESVAFQPGRSYAFVNFVRDEDAFEAVKALKGFDLAGSPLRIQFAKADKSSVSLRDESYSYGREERRSPFLQRDSRTHAGGHGADYLMDSKAASNASETPSEVLWIGFPAFLKVDEMILRKAFSPFGEIENITAFPGRTYAFVRFRNVMSACRAKETLEGKLFDNPRVHICFARSESGGGSANAGRRSFGMDGPHSPYSRSSGRGGSSDEFGLNREGYVDPEVMGYGKRESFWSGGKDAHDRKRIQDFGPEMGYGRSPGRNGSRFNDFSPTRLPRGSGFPDEPWDSPDGPPHLYSESKRLKTGHPFPLDNEFPDYGRSEAENIRYGLRNSFSNKRIPDYPAISSSSRRFGDKGDEFMSQRESYQPDLGSSSFNRVGSTRRLTPDLPPPPPSIGEWKWQGIIAKGGTPVCRARCFPVGKVLDFALPEFLDCTARTGLDMLAKHYYQAAGNWVVFFVPESDADMSHYNEFLHFLEEKQRVAVAKLDDQNTLFLVPPSEFSEKVLKVPGKLSISGVILRLEPATAAAPLPERKDAAHHLHSHRDAPYPSSVPNSSSRYPSSQAAMVMQQQHGTSSNPSLSDYDFTNPTSGQHHLNPGGPPLYNKLPSVTDDPKLVSSVPISNFASGALQPDQIALLAASLLGQQPSGQLGGGSTGGLSENLVNTAQRYDHRQTNPQAQNSFAQQQQPPPPQPPNAPGGGAETDPQRLQATLQLAAALLQQIHQSGKGS